MNRLIKTLARVLAPLALAALLCAAGYAGVDMIMMRARERQDEQSLEHIRRCTAQYYAVNGSYPMSFEKLEQRYGIVLDDGCVCHYRRNGANLMPDIAVVRTK